MKDKKETHVYLGRHSLRPKGDLPESKKFPGIAEPGVELGRRKAESDVLEFIQQSPKNAIVFIGGVSDEERTKSTARIFAETLADIIGKSDDYFVSHKTIEKWIRKGKSPVVAIRALALKEKNKKNRLVIDLPLFLKQLSSKRARTVLSESKYFQELKKRTGEDQHKLVRMWIETDGHLDGIEEGPKPQAIADNYKNAISRLEQFIQKELPNRPVSVIVVGHSWELDVAITAFANNGKVDLESFDRVTQGGIIKETEAARIVFGPKETTVTYRGKEFRSKSKP